DLFAFLMAFNSGTRPAVGAQVTVTAANKASAGVTTPISQIIAQTVANNCDLIVKGTVGGVSKGWVYDGPSASLLPDTTTEAPVAEATLRNGVAGTDVLVYTGVPKGAGKRLGVDRDRDGFLDRDEVAGGTDPANPNSNPWQF